MNPMATTEPPLRPRTAADVRLNVGWYRRGRYDPTTWIGQTWMVRAMLTPDGPATARVDWSDPQAEVRVAAWGPGADRAAAAIEAMAAPGRVLGPPPGAPRLVRDAARRRPYLAAGASGDLYHALLPTILEQRITVREAMRQWSRLARRLGEAAPGPFPGLLLPPRPEHLARIPAWWLHPLGIEAKRASALAAVARVAGHLWEWAELADRGELAAKLALIPGVGPWTVGTVLGPVCGDDDAVAVGDLHLPHLVSWNLAGEPRGDDQRMLELLEPYRPQRGRVLRLLTLAGRRPPAYGPKHRILPMHRF